MIDATAGMNSLIAATAIAMVQRKTSGRAKPSPTKRERTVNTSTAASMHRLTVRPDLRSLSTRGKLCSASTVTPPCFIETSVSSPQAVAAMRTEPESTRDPAKSMFERNSQGISPLSASVAMTVLNLWTGRLFSVIPRSLTTASSPVMTLPSQGTVSPASRKMMSPGTISSARRRWMRPSWMTEECGMRSRAISSRMRLARTAAAVRSRAPATRTAAIAPASKRLSKTAAAPALTASSSVGRSKRAESTSSPAGVRFTGHTLLEPEARRRFFASFDERP